ncbi:MAG: hypothetical protein ACRD3W_32470 [Terriglobales bacterium]
MIPLAPPARKHKIEVQHLRYERSTEKQRLSKLQVKVIEKMQTRESKPGEMRAA